jgi:hypothetical protein
MNAQDSITRRDAAHKDAVPVQLGHLRRCKFVQLCCCAFYMNARDSITRTRLPALRCNKFCASSAACSDSFLVRGFGDAKTSAGPKDMTRLADDSDLWRDAEGMRDTDRTVEA